MTSRKRFSGFSLVEMAVVMAIVALLLGSAMLTLSAQQEQRAFNETNQKLKDAVEAIIAFAIVNQRLPCPAVLGTTGVEVLASGTTATGGPCTNSFGGYVPALSLGMAPVSSDGYLLDNWGNRIRYAVSATIDVTTCSGAGPFVATPHFTSKAYLKANGVSCKPNDLDICSSTTGITGSGTPTAACGSTVRAASAQTVAFVVFSTGKNGASTSAYGAAETANTNSDPVFIYQTPSGTYDDLMTFVSAGVVYQKLISAGALP